MMKGCLTFCRMAASDTAYLTWFLVMICFLRSTFNAYIALELFLRARYTFPKAPEPKSFNSWKDLKLTLFELSMSSAVDFVERATSFGGLLGGLLSSRKRRFLFRRRSSSLGSSYNSTAALEERVKQF